MLPLLTLILLAGETSAPIRVTVTVQPKCAVIETPQGVEVRCVKGTPPPTSIEGKTINF